MMLESIWFVLWGVLWAVYFTLDGFDFGLGMLLPFTTKNDTERRMVYSSMGPFWDGNEVWLIAAGGITFAAFPRVYAVLFSSFYSALMIILFALIIRGVSIEYRGKLKSKIWKRIWDCGLFLGSVLPALLFGVAFANIFQGIPIDAKGIYHGSLFTLLNPYGIIGGLLFVALFLVHGATWLGLKTEGELHRRAVCTAKVLWAALLLVAVLFLMATALATNLYMNYLKMPVLFLIPALCVVALLLNRFFLGKVRMWAAWFCSGLTILCAVLFGVIGLYPSMLPSSIDATYGLTAFNSMSSALTLKIMLGVVVVFVPIIIGYQAWAYRLFREKVTEESLSYEEAY